MDIENHPWSYLERVKDSQGKEFICMKNTSNENSKNVKDFSSCVPASSTSLRKR